MNYVVSEPIESEFENPPFRRVWLINPKTLFYHTFMVFKSTTTEVCIRNFRCNINSLIESTWYRRASLVQMMTLTVQMMTLTPMMTLTDQENEPWKILPFYEWDHKGVLAEDCYIEFVQSYLKYFAEQAAVCSIHYMSILLDCQKIWYLSLLLLLGSKNCHNCTNARTLPSPMSVIPGLSIQE